MLEVPMPSNARETDPILFEAALSMRGKCFSLDSEGEAQLVLQVPEQFARVLSDNIHRRRDCSFHRPNRRRGRRAGGTPQGQEKRMSRDPQKPSDARESAKHGEPAKGHGAKT